MSGYQAPPPQIMATAQNSDDAIRLIVAQRALYSRAKRYLSGRLTGMFIIAIAAPIVGGLWPDLSVVCGAVAGAWIFIGRTCLAHAEDSDVSKAAAVQDKFDALVFHMPDVKDREALPSLEDINKLTGSKSDAKRTASREKLRDWYPLDLATSGLRAIAICQRANVSYSDSLLRRTAQIWRVCVVLWGVIAVGLCLYYKLGLEDVLLVVALPLLPAFLDLLEFSRSYQSASYVRSSTAKEIAKSLANGASPQPGQVLVWQERLYELRRTTPLVPNVIYWLQRKSNERAMKRSASQLAKTK